MQLFYNRYCAISPLELLALAPHKCEMDVAPTARSSIERRARGPIASIYLASNTSSVKGIVDQLIEKLLDTFSLPFSHVNKPQTHSEKSVRYIHGREIRVRTSESVCFCPRRYQLLEESFVPYRVPSSWLLWASSSAVETSFGRSIIPLSPQPEFCICVRFEALCPSQRSERGWRLSNGTPCPQRLQIH